MLHIRSSRPLGGWGGSAGSLHTTRTQKRAGRRQPEHPLRDRIGVPARRSSHAAHAQKRCQKVPANTVRKTFVSVCVYVRHQARNKPRVTASTASTSVPATTRMSAMRRVALEHDWLRK